MTMVVRLAAMLVTVVALLPAVTAAQPLQGLYVSLGAGANLADDLLSTHERTKVYTTVGPVGIADLGWKFGNGLRMEIEGSYRSNSASGFSRRRANGALQPLANVDGTAATHAVMANIAYDFPMHPFGLPLQPYVGAGIGYGWLDLGGIHGNEPVLYRVPNAGTVVAPSLVALGTAGALAYQAMVGVSMPVRPVPGLSATLEYRFFGMASPDAPINFVSVGGNTVNGVVPSATAHDRVVVADHAILIGLRYIFGSPPMPVAAVQTAPVPARVSAPMAARSYLVFFDWDKTVLTGRASQIIADAASASGKIASTRIETNGYTDTSGTSESNQALSLRRAEAVAAELVRDGVPKSAISIQGVGDTRLLVPTSLGVHKAQNRRVEIIIR